MKRRYSIKLTVISLFILTTCLTASVAIGLQYYFSKQQALQSALQKYQNISSLITKEVKNVDRVFSNLTLLLSGLGQDFEQFDENLLARTAFAQLMRGDPIFYSLYIARADGHFYQLINLNSLEEIREDLGAESSDRWVLVEIIRQGQKNIKTTSFFDHSFQLRDKVSVESKYNAVQRPWFVGAQNSNLFKTEPYLFHNVQVSGQTYASKIDDSVFGSVLGMDVISETLSNKIKGRLGHAITKLPAEFYVYDETGALKASSNDNKLISLPDVTPLSLTKDQQSLIASIGNIEVSNQTNWPPLDFAVRGKPAGYFVDKMRIIGLKTGIRLKFINGVSWAELVEEYKQGDVDILYPVANNATNRSFGALSAPLARFDFGLATSGNGYGGLEQLLGKKLGILKGWSIIEEIRVSHPEVQIVELDDLYAGLLSLYSGDLDAVMDLNVILESTIEQHFFDGLTVNVVDAKQDLHSTNTFHMAIENIDSQMGDIINQAIASFTPEEIRFLETKWFSKGSPSGVVPYEFLIDATKDESLRDQLLTFEVDGESYFTYIEQIDLFERGTEYFSITVPSESLLDAALSNVVASTLGSAALLTLLIPLSRVFSKPIVSPIQALIEETKKVRERRYSDVDGVPSRIKEIYQLSRSIETTANELSVYEKQQQEFVDSFIKLIAQAIDDKSPYTAGHCNRVPELAIMLVDQAEKSSDGSFAEFGFESDAQRREFRIAAWLHDCGKITTPEHIVDKGSKLEANYNRIHEVRTRFEVMIRDQIIAFYQQQAPTLQPEQDSALQGDIELLKQEFAEVANANVGGEFMDDEAVERIEQIAKRTWTRYLDDQLGLSPEEQRRLESRGIRSVTPAVESLLADKAEHLYKHPSKIEYDPSFEIKMEVPEYLANRGEVYNLIIRKGTLTAEDRFKINEHIISTIKMLERMPFPDDLSKVPRYASTHHETMKGTGYPRQLKGEELSIPERIMALADVFEALTAADRPYKSAKTLSESLRIMKFMVQDEHLDKETYRLFLSSGTYLEYAKRYLAPEQIDEVDIEEYWV
ncbi:HD domain-containing phosphohydrolase [Vibrio breoganii]